MKMRMTLTAASSSAHAAESVKVQMRLSRRGHSIDTHCFVDKYHLGLCLEAGCVKCTTFALSPWFFADGLIPHAVRSSRDEFVGLMTGLRRSHRDNIPTHYIARLTWHFVSLHDTCWQPVTEEVAAVGTVGLLMLLLALVPASSESSPLDRCYRPKFPFTESSSDYINSQSRSTLKSLVILPAALVA